MAGARDQDGPSLAWRSWLSLALTRRRCLTRPSVERGSRRSGHHGSAAVPPQAGPRPRPSGGCWPGGCARHMGPRRVASRACLRLVGSLFAAPLEPGLPQRPRLPERTSVLPALTAPPGLGPQGVGHTPTRRGCMCHSERLPCWARPHLPTRGRASRHCSALCPLGPPLSFPPSPGPSLAQPCALMACPSGATAPHRARLRRVWPPRALAERGELRPCSEDGRSESPRRARRRRLLSIRLCVLCYLRTGHRRDQGCGPARGWVGGWRGHVRAQSSAWVKNSPWHGGGGCTSRGMCLAPEPSVQCGQSCDVHVRGVLPQ